MARSTRGSKDEEEMWKDSRLLVNILTLAGSSIRVARKKQVIQINTDLVLQQNLFVLDMFCLLTSPYVSQFMTT